MRTDLAGTRRTTSNSDERLGPVSRNRGHVVSEDNNVGGGQEGAAGTRNTQHLERSLLRSTRSFRKTTSGGPRARCVWGEKSSPT